MSWVRIGLAQEDPKIIESAHILWIKELEVGAEVRLLLRDDVVHFKTNTPFRALVADVEKKTPIKLKGLMLTRMDSERKIWVVVDHVAWFQQEDDGESIYTNIQLTPAGAISVRETINTIEEAL